MFSTAWEMELRDKHSLKHTPLNLEKDCSIRFFSCKYTVFTCWLTDCVCLLFAERSWAAVVTVISICGGIISLIAIFGGRIRINIFMNNHSHGNKDTTVYKEKVHWETIIVLKQRRWNWIQLPPNFNLTWQLHIACVAVFSVSSRANGKSREGMEWEQKVRNGGELPLIFCYLCAPGPRATPIRPKGNGK